MFRGRSRTAATSKMEHFVIIAITKCYILDVAEALDPSLVDSIKTLITCVWETCNGESLMLPLPLLILMFSSKESQTGNYFY